MTAPDRQRILVVDDEAVIRDVLCDLLDLEGYAVRSAIHGADAWAALQHERPDLLLTDYNMPIMNGGELLLRLREDPRLRDLPVVLTSTGWVPPAVLAVADRFAPKTGFEELLDAIHALLPPNG